jgi:hypothetical protein
LIALIIDAHRPDGAFCSPAGPVTDPIISPPRPNSTRGTAVLDLSNHTKHAPSDTGAVSNRQDTRGSPPEPKLRRRRRTSRPKPPRRDPAIRTCLLFTMTKRTSKPDPEGPGRKTVLSDRMLSDLRSSARPKLRWSHPDRRRRRPIRQETSSR